MKRSTGLRDWLNNGIGIIFLIVGIAAFKKTLSYMPLSIAIVIWSGISLVGTILLDVYFFKTHIDGRVALFMVLSMASIMGLHYYASQMR